MSVLLRLRKTSQTLGPKFGEYSRSTIKNHTVMKEKLGIVNLRYILAHRSIEPSRA
jgi:hypothetical protein